MRKTVVFLSAVVLSFLVVGSLSAQDRGRAEQRRQPPPSSHAVPREQPRAVPRPPAPPPRYNEYRRWSYPQYGFYFDFRYRYPYSYYYPRYYPGPYERICIPGHWEYDQYGYTVWVTGYCNIPYHYHDQCYYYYDCR